MPVIRSRGLDAVRVIAMLAIVTGHLWTLHPWIRPAFFTWHVPIFFFLAGYLWNERRGFLAEVRHRALTVLLPFVAWVVLLVLLLHQDPPGTALHDIAQQAWRSQGFVRPFWAYWFALALFFSAFGYRLVSRLHWAARTTVVLGSAVAVTSLAGTGHLLPLHLGQGVVCTVWILAGHALRQASSRAELRWGHSRDLAPARIALGAALLGTAVVTVVAVPDLDLDLHSLDLGVPLLSVLVSLMICTGLVLVAGELRDSALPVVTSDLARAALVVMLVHLAVIDQVADFSHPRVGDLLVVIAASWGVGLVLTSVPRAWYLTGQRPSQAPKTPPRIPQPAPARAE